MTVNPRDVIDEVILRTVQQGWQCDVQTDDILDALAAAGFVVVACPPGSRVVVSRESKRCEPCGGAGQWYHQDTYDAVSCESCGGSGVVEATTIHGLAEVRLGWIDEDGAERPLHPFAVERMLYDETLYRMVALPEETPHA